MSPPLPTVIKVSWNHNHPLNTAEALRMLRVTDEVKQQYFDYFADGMTPSEAINLHQSSLIIGDASYELLADASRNPTSRQVQHMYDEWRKENLGPSLNPFDKLLEKKQMYIDSGVTVCINKDIPWAVLIVTPIMKRAQELTSSKEMIFLDSTASCESSGSTVTVLLTATKAGAVPIAVLVHQSQTSECYQRSFELLKSTFPLCFGQAKAPLIFMTDDSAAEKAALREVWPSAIHLLCHFHVAQAEWRYLWTSSIPKEERPRLMKLFQQVMYADTETSLEKSLEALYEVEDLFPHFVRRFRAFFKRKHEWVSLYRRDLLTRSHNTNNFCEATIRILKDIVLRRTKAFNVVALTEFCVLIWENYLSIKLLDHAFNRKKKSTLLYECLLKKTSYEASDIKIIEDGVFAVPSEKDRNKFYMVDAMVGTCSCPSGRSGTFCKHQCLLFNENKISLPNAPAITQVDRHALGILALGEKCPPFSFFQSLKHQLDDPEDENEEIMLYSQDEMVIQDNDDSIVAEVANGTEIEEPMDVCQETQNAYISEEETATEEDLEELADEFKRWKKLCGGKLPKKNIQQLLNAMKKVSSKEQAISSVRLATLAISANARSRSGKKIRVQPASIARQRAGLTRGSFRVPSGRPVTSKKSKGIKRQRNLSQNIRLNQANAKSHGSSH